MSNISNLAEAREARRLQQPHQSSGKGYALLHRKIMDVPFYKDAEAAHLWVHLILKAKHTPEYVMTDAGEILVGRGKLLGGRNSLAFETGLKPDRVQYLLRKFKKLGMIDWVSHGKFSVFSVEKYDDYQSNFVPADYQQITTSKPAIPMHASNTVPADYQQITTDKEYNNIISNTDVLESATADKKSDKKKPSVSCQDVVDAYHEILPEAPRIRALNDKRKNQIRTFWRKAGVITRQLDGHGFTMQDWRNYLSYVGENCRWMFEERPNHQRGTIWHKKGFDFLLNDNTYLKVREG
ncbi:DNA replication protein, partial [Escherichia coli]